MNVKSLDGGLLDCWNLVEGNLVLENEAGNEDGSVSGQLELA